MDLGMTRVTMLKKDLPILHLWPILLQVLQVLQAQTLSKVSDKFKTGVGYDSQVFDSQVNDKYKTGEGFQLVELKTSESKAKSVSEPLIEDWISDSENENKTESKSIQRKHITPSDIQYSTATRILGVLHKPTMNSARTTSNVFNKAHTHVRRPFNKSTTNKNSNLKEKVNTVKGNVTTAGPKAVVSVNKGNEANAVKASACWVWRPKQKVLDHISRHNGASMNFKRFDYLELQEKGVIDSGCSRHMTGNKSYLSDYEEIDGGFVAFGGDSKGGRITGKGKISTGKLDFEDVYFVKELKFNLFSVSQMCDKKNSVLFTGSSMKFNLPSTWISSNGIASGSSAMHFFNLET
ncbi:hypothetical protein Tco_1462908 [Tanacetum coccineum]